jgi:hypothetical protein
VLNRLLLLLIVEKSLIFSCLGPGSIDIFHLLLRVVRLIPYFLATVAIQGDCDDFQSASAVSIAAILVGWKVIERV